MGGGGGSTPAPKTFTPPPLQDGPATNPVPNWFAQAAGSSPRPDPFQALANLPVAQAQNPFGQPNQPVAMPIVQQIQRTLAAAPQQQQPEPAKAAPQLTREQQMQAAIAKPWFQLLGASPENADAHINGKVGLGPDTPLRLGKGNR